MSEFIAFPKITQYDKQVMTITQKLHGTNAQIYIDYMPTDVQWHCDGCDVVVEELTARAGSRTRWLRPEDDNYDFAKFVEENQEELIKALGPGRHHGEWCGPGINSGEGLKERRFFLFNQEFSEKELPPQVSVVPMLYNGPYSSTAVEATMTRLRSGSQVQAARGYKNVEGIVIDLDGVKYKKVFRQEETAWKPTKPAKIPINSIDVSHLLQPIRLEKLLSQDERMITEYPHSLKALCRWYVHDLEEEGQLYAQDNLPLNEGKIKDIKKALSKQLYPFIKDQMLEKCRHEIIDEGLIDMRTSQLNKRDGATCLHTTYCTQCLYSMKFDESSQRYEKVNVHSCII